MNFFEMLVLTHFVADWVFQTQKHANRKHEDFNVLLTHSFIYTIFFIPLLLWKIHYVLPVFLMLLLLLISHAFLDNRKFEFWILKKIKGIHMTTDLQPYYLIDDESIRMLDKGLFWIILIAIDQIFHITILACIALVWS